eukprot:gb/GECG01007559.1/.p1 GENE.gb/GECG01007559.1/~~gb/GECG01007559.1/.p1  ORF type:complete len:472 (+),score=45.09 gb/GECG01007559.1/:1-1416(+)
MKAADIFSRYRNGHGEKTSSSPSRSVLMGLITALVVIVLHTCYRIDRSYGNSGVPYNSIFATTDDDNKREYQRSSPDARSLSGHSTQPIGLDPYEQNEARMYREVKINDTVFDEQMDGQIMEQLLEQKFNSNNKWYISTAKLPGGGTTKLNIKSPHGDPYMLKLYCSSRVRFGQKLFMIYDEIVAAAINHAIFQKPEPSSKGAVLPLYEEQKAMIKNTSTRISKLYPHCFFGRAEKEYYTGALITMRSGVSLSKGGCTMFKEHPEDTARLWILDVATRQSDRNCRSNALRNKTGGVVMSDFTGGPDTQFVSPFCSLKGGSEHMLLYPFFTNKKKPQSGSLAKMYCQILSTGLGLFKSFPSFSEMRERLFKILVNDEFIKGMAPSHFRMGKKRCTKQQPSTRCIVSAALGLPVSNNCISDFVARRVLAPKHELIAAFFANVYAIRLSKTHSSFRQMYDKRSCATMEEAAAGL